ncbi:MAG: ankyrin repeat domain-containing protein [Gammaproteobacteria bacterium]
MSASRKNKKKAEKQVVPASNSNLQISRGLVSGVSPDSSNTNPEQRVAQHEAEMGVMTVYQQYSAEYEKALATGNTALINQAQDRLARVFRNEALLEVEGMRKHLEVLSPSDPSYQIILQAYQQTRQELLQMDMMIDQQETNKNKVKQNPGLLNTPGTLSDLYIQEQKIEDYGNKTTELFSHKLPLLKAPKTISNLIMSMQTSHAVQGKSISSLFEKAQETFRLPDLMKTDQSLLKVEKLLLNGLLFWLNSEHHKQAKKIKSLIVPAQIDQWTLSAIADWLIVSAQKIPRFQNISEDSIFSIIDMLMLYIELQHEKIKAIDINDEKNLVDYQFANSQLIHFTAITKFLIQNASPTVKAKYPTADERLSEIVDEISLRYAVWSNNMGQLTDILTNRGNDFVKRTQGFCGKTLLIMAAQKNHLAIVKKLVECGVDTLEKARTPEGNTALFYGAKYYGVTKLLIKTNPEILKVKNNNNLDVYGQLAKTDNMSYGQFILKRVTQKKSKQLIAEEKNPGVSPEESLQQSAACLDSAMQSFAEKDYLNAGLKINEAVDALNRIKNGLISDQRAYEIYKFKQRIEMAQGDYDNAVKSARYFCNLNSRVGNKKLSRSEKIVPVIEFVKAVAAGKLEVAQIIFRNAHPELKKTLINARGKANKTVLMMAYAQDNVALQRFLLQADMALDLNLQDDEEKTVIHHLVSTDNERIDSLLVLTDLRMSRSFDINLADFYGRTPLHYAALHGHLNCVQHLLSLDAIANAEDNEGTKPVELCKTDAVRDLFTQVQPERLEIKRSPDQDPKPKQHHATIRSSIIKDDQTSVDIHARIAPVKALIRKLRNPNLQLGSQIYESLLPEIFVAIKTLENNIRSHPGHISHYLLLTEITMLTKNEKKYQVVSKELTRLFPGEIKTEILFANLTRLSGHLGTAYIAYQQILENLEKSSTPANIKKINKLKVKVLFGKMKCIRPTNLKEGLEICEAIIALEPRNPIVAREKQKFLSRLEKKQTIQSLPTTQVAPVESAHVAIPAAEPAQINISEGISTTLEEKTLPYIDAIFNDAWTLVQQGDIQQAQALYEQAKAINMIEAKFGLGICAEYLNNLPAAHAYYAEVSANSVHHSGAALRLIVVTAKQNQNLIMQNDQNFLAFMQRFPHVMAGCAEYSSYLWATGRPLDAIIMNEKLTSEDPGYIKGHLQLIEKYISFQYFPKAIEHCEHFLRINLSKNIKIKPSATNIDLNLHHEYALHLCYIRVLILHSYQQQNTQRQVIMDKAHHAIQQYRIIFGNFREALNELQYMLTLYKLPVNSLSVKQPKQDTQAVQQVMSEVKITPTTTKPGVDVLGKTLEDMLDYLFKISTQGGEITKEQIEVIQQRKPQFKCMQNDDFNKLLQKYFLSGFAFSFYRLICEINIQLEHEMFPSTGESITLDMQERNHIFITTQLIDLDDAVQNQQSVGIKHVYAIFIAKEIFEDCYTDSFLETLSFVIDQYEPPFTMNEFFTDFDLNTTINNYANARYIYEKQVCEAQQQMQTQQSDVVGALSSSATLWQPAPLNTPSSNPTPINQQTIGLHS